MSRTVLIVSTMPGAEHCAAAVAESAQVEVAVAAGRDAGLHALRARAFDVVVLEESLVEGDPGWAEEAWTAAGVAMQVEVSFARAGCARLAREVKAALIRRDGDQAVARRVAVTELENDLKSSVTGLLLESELALRDPAIPVTLEPKLRHLVELAGALRQRLEHAPEEQPREGVRGLPLGPGGGVGW